MISTLGDLKSLHPEISRQVDGFVADTAVVPVSDLYAHELVISGKDQDAELILQDVPEVKAECALIVWYDGGPEQDGLFNEPIACEFSFRYKDQSEASDPNEKFSREVASRAVKVFEKIQVELDQWVDLGALTKTALAYDYRDA